MHVASRYCGIPCNRHSALRSRAVYHRAVRQSFRLPQPVPRARCISMAHFSDLQRVDGPAAHRVAMLAGQQKLDYNTTPVATGSRCVCGNPHIWGTLSAREPYTLAAQRKRTTRMTCTVALFRGGPLGTFSTWASKSSILETEFSNRALGSWRSQCLARRKPALSLRSPCGVYLASIGACITNYSLDTLKTCELHHRQLQTPLVPTHLRLGTNRYPGNQSPPKSHGEKYPILDPCTWESQFSHCKSSISTVPLAALPCTTSIILH
jgi:hypothetical protein